MTKRKANPQKWWRPSEMTPEKVKKLEEAFALDCTIEEACFFADISKPTYYSRIEKKPELLIRFEALRQNPVLLARQSVIKNMQKNGELALKYLERKKKNEFTPKTEVEHWWNVTSTIVKIWHKKN